jgi:hypothetical protein
LAGIVAGHLDEGRSHGGAASEPQHDDGRAGLARVPTASSTGDEAALKDAGKGGGDWSEAAEHLWPGTTGIGSHPR